MSILSGLSSEVEILQPLRGMVRLSEIKQEAGATEDLCFSPDGKYLTASFSGQVLILDVETFAVKQILNKHSRRFHNRVGHGSDTFSSSGEFIASSYHQDPHISVYKFKRNSWRYMGSLRSHRGHKAPVLGLAFHPTNNKLLASGSMDRTIKIWNVKKLESLYTLQGHGGAVTSVAFSSDGKLLISGSQDGTVRVWDTDSYKLVCASSQVSPFTFVAFLPDNRRIISAHWDGHFKFWTIHENEIELDKAFIAHTGHSEFPFIIQAKLSFDGLMLATAGSDDRVMVWRTETGEKLNNKRIIVPDGNQTSIAFSPDGRLLAVGSSWGNIMLWKIKHCLINRNRP